MKQNAKNNSPIAKQTTAQTHPLQLLIQSKSLRIAALVTITLSSFGTLHAQDASPAQQIQISNTTNDTQLVTGTVSDDIKTPLPEAHILLEGTHIGVVTDFDGKFEFPKRLKEGDRLIVSYIGYQTQYVTIKKEQAPLDLVLNLDNVLITCDEQTNETYTTKHNLWQKVKALF